MNLHIQDFDVHQMKGSYTNSLRMRGIAQNEGPPFPFVKH
jgi:hypothetical protein